MEQVTARHNRCILKSRADFRQAAGALVELISAGSLAHTSNSFGSSHLGSRLKPVFAHAGQESYFLLFVRRRSTMVRKGWTSVEVPDGWLQVIRGKRPPSVQWPRAGSQQHARQTGKPALESRKPPKTGSQSASRQRVNPDQLRAAASARIQRIQASLGALQSEDIEERQALLSALEKAKRQEVPPMEKQILATEECLARAKKRLLQHDATIAATREALQKAEHDKEVDVQGVDGEDLRN